MKIRGMIMVAVWLLLMGAAGMLRADEWTMEPVLMMSHGSDILAGCPMTCHIDEGPGVDEVAFGVTLYSPTKAFEVDLTHGVRVVDCHVFRNPCKGYSATTVRVRWYPWRNR